MLSQQTAMCISSAVFLFSQIWSFVDTVNAVPCPLEVHGAFCYYGVHVADQM